MLRNLTPEQQQAILQQLGNGAGTGNGGALNGTGQFQRGGQNQDPAAVERERRLQAERDRRDRDELYPVLKPDDTVLISIGYTLPPVPVTNGGGSYGAAANGGGFGIGGTLPQTGNGTQPATGASQATGSPAPDTGAPLTDSERRDLDRLIDLVRSGNPYRLDRTGAIQLPGFPPIPVAGLSEDQATMLLQAEPALRRIQVRVTRLPLARSGFESLKPFGYDLFENAPTTFAPVTDVPVPADYVVGAGDELSVQLFGSQNRSLRLVVGRDGRINFPELGPISVAGQRFSSVREMLEARIARQMIGVHGSVSMGDTRSIRIFVLGEAKYPGSYTVSGLATMTAALFASGGVKPIGSLRNIELKRQGAVVRRLDLYDLLIRGDTRDDAQLLPGDVIFIPPLGSTVSIDGEVRRPAIYELKGESDIADLVQLAGGLTPEADTGKASLSRVDESQRRVVVEVDLSSAQGRRLELRNGDSLRVGRLRPQYDSGVQLAGYVYRPGAFAWHEGMRLTEVIGSVDEVKPDGDLGYILIRRELPPDRHIVVLSADLATALRDPASPANIVLMPRDRITVFDLASGRERILAPLINELRIQGGFNQPTEIVRVEGRVKVPGEYPLEPQMRVSDLIRAGGSLTDAAYGGTAELTRYEVVKGESRETEHITVDLAAVRRGDVAADLKLRPFDYLNIQEVPAWGKLEQVTLRGEFRFPGTYPIRRGETLKALVARAGGLTDLAFARGAVFTRMELKRQEQEQLDTLQVRLKNDIATLALQGAASANSAQATSAVQVGQSLLGQLQTAKAVGRLVINLHRIVTTPAGSGWDVDLRDGDELIVPELRQEVTVIGEVQTNTSHLYHQGLTREDYIALSGGFTHRADKGRIYVVHADGSVVADAGSRWYKLGSGTPIETGDTIVVPMDVEHLPPLPLWLAVTTIIYNIAVAVAAVHAL
jgi:protein involved in polysaccharide export with SLBB domain